MSGTNAKLIAAGHASVHDFGDGESVADIADELAYALTAAEREVLAVRADLREAQQLLHILASRAGGVFITKAEIVSYSAGGAFLAAPEMDGVRIVRT